MSLIIPEDQGAYVSLMREIAMDQATTSCEIRLVTFIPGFKYASDNGKAGLWFLMDQGKLLVKKTQVGCVVPDGADIARWALIPNREFYFGALNGKPCYAGGLDHSRPLPDNWEWTELRALFSSIDEELLWAAGRANQLVDWDQSHQFCGRCGRPTQNKKDERAKLCTHCGLVNYPRLSPAVIVAVLKGDRILLARNKGFRGPIFSVLAGFVEPGETLEACVEREIREEVGIGVKNIHYFGSQPWPFPNSLMIAFVAEHASGEIAIDRAEIVEAGWFSRLNLPPIPSSVSIARRLIDWFFDSH